MNESLEPDGGNLYRPHFFQINSGLFWRCAHGSTGFGDNLSWIGCRACLDDDEDAYREWLANCEQSVVSRTNGRETIDRLILMAMLLKTSVARLNYLSDKILNIKVTPISNIAVRVGAEDFDLMRQMAIQFKSMDPLTIDQAKNNVEL